MSQEKAQLIAPQGHFTVPGLNVAGVVTASSFSGNCTGTASSITQGTNVVVGVMTASSFGGDVFGNAAGLSTTTAGLKLGIVTATSFGGNFTGIGSGLTGTPNIVAGLVTATQFIGNTPGLAAGISAGKNLAAGIVTATTFYGDGSNLTGAGSTAYIRQTVRASESTTTINLNDGNIIYYEGTVDTTISIANTSTAEDVSIVRTLSPISANYNVSYSTGAVDFDVNGDFLTLASTSDFNFGTGDYTLEAWLFPDDVDAAEAFVWLNFGNTDAPSMKIIYGKWEIFSGGSKYGGPATAGVWTHVAVTRSSGIARMFVNGQEKVSWADSADIPNSIASIGAYPAGTYEWDGKISNLRVVKGTALYTSSFTPPTEALTNVSGTVLLCCQDTSSTTVGAVKPGTITANGDPSAGSVTVSKSGTSTLYGNGAITWPTSITWNGGSAPTLVSSRTATGSAQIFNLTTADGGTTWYGYEEFNYSTVGSNYNIFTWGANDHGTLGLNSVANISSPVQLTGATWTDGTSGGAQHRNGTSFFRKSDGTAWIWGDNTQGCLGLNSRTDYSSPVQLGTETNWGYCFAGGYQTGASKTDGTLWTWGTGMNGVNYNVGPGKRSSPTQIPGTTWSSDPYMCSFSYGQAGAIRTDGTLWVWGRNDYGGLGRNNTTNAPGVSSPIQLGSGTDWSRIFSGHLNRTAMKTDGTLWSWGCNQQGRGGLNDNAHRSSPTQIPGTWSSFSSSSYQGFGIKTGGTLWSWG